MSNMEHTSLEDLADTLALHIQKLRSKGLLKETETLLNLDYTSQAAQAPFLFDMARGVLHRNNCVAISRSSRSTLYAVWEMRAGDEELTCPVCCPGSGKQSQIQTEGASDILFGIISFLDQFSSVLRERGKEYRNSNRGSALALQVEKLVAYFDETSRNLLNIGCSRSVSIEPFYTCTQKARTSFPGHHPRRPKRKVGSRKPL